MKKRMLSLLLAVALVLGLCPGVFAAGSSYADVLDTHWAHPYIEDVTEKGIMNGVDDKNFAPEDAMTRAMFVTRSRSRPASPMSRPGSGIPLP